MNLRTPDQFHSRTAQGVMGVVGLVLGYLFATRAIDTGSWIQYGIALLLFILGIKRIARAFEKRK